MKISNLLVLSVLFIAAAQAQTQPKPRLKVNPNAYPTITMGVIAEQEAEAAAADCEQALESLSRESKMAAFEEASRMTQGAFKVSGANKTEAEYVSSIQSLKAAAKAACAN